MTCSQGSNLVELVGMVLGSPDDRGLMGLAAGLEAALEMGMDWSLR